MTSVTPVSAELAAKEVALAQAQAKAASKTEAVAFAKELQAAEQSQPRGTVEKLSPAKQFEAVFIGQMISEIMPKDSELFGEGLSGEIWHSMMSEHMAEAIVKSTDFGLADLIDREVPGANTAE